MSRIVSIESEFRTLAAGRPAMRSAPGDRGWELTISRPAFARLMERVGRGADPVIVSPAWFARESSRVEVLLHSLASSASQEPDARVVVAGSSNPVDLRNHIRQIMRYPPVVAPAVYVSIGMGEAAGHITAESVSADGIKPLSIVRVVAETLPEMHLNGPDPVAADHEMGERWSRSMGALGEKTWRKLSSLRIALFGCGRTGSLMANALARSGVTQLNLVDFDRMEFHNYGEMDVVRLSDVGRNKAESIADGLRIVTDTAVEDVPETATSWASLAAAKDADVLITCVDNPSARLAVDFLARLYLKPLLDIGTGIFGVEPLTRRMGADIRFLLPGHCLDCYGGLGQIERAATGLARARPDPVEWRQERAGSLRSLNMIGVGSGLRLLEDFLGGRVHESVWLNLEYAGEFPNFRRMTPPAVYGSCRICALTGLGDRGLEEVPLLLAKLKGHP